MPPTPAWPLTATSAAASIFTEFVVKTHSLCNLACTYCYVYEMADQSWRDKPVHISAPTVRKVAERIAEHAATHRLPAIRVILHGGEPLLADADGIASIATRLRDHIEPSTELRLSVQTNGVLLTRTILDALAAHRIGVSVSIDGSQADHDRYRKYRNGRGSYHAVAAGIDLLRSAEYRFLYRGLISTVNLSNHPIRTYEALTEFAPPRMDFLLPHGNWSEPPPGRPDDATTPYADWLREVFDRWYGSDEPQPEIRLFTEIIHLLLGGAPAGEMIGLSAPTVVVVETDGTIEQVDALKSAYEGAAATGMDVWRHSFDQVADHPKFAERKLGVDGLSARCQRCKIVPVCGGGYYPHRYRKTEGFDNPSVYCADLEALIEYVRSRIVSDLSQVRSDA